MKMHKSNLAAALQLAIDVQQKNEQKQGYKTESAFLAGLKEIYFALQRGEGISIQ